LHGTVNKQNLLYRSAANPYKLHQRPFKTKKSPFSALFGLTSSCILLLRGWRRTSHHSHIATLQWAINF